MKACLSWLPLLTVCCVALAAEPWTVGTIVGMGYPRHALTVGLEGKVEIRCHIGNDGRVLNTERVSGDMELASAAEKNALKWKFRRVDSGQGTYVLVYHFEIRKVNALGQSPGFRFVLPGDVFVTAEKLDADHGRH